MSADADLILEKVSNLSVSELLAVRDRIDAELYAKKNKERKAQPTQSIEQPSSKDSLIYTRTAEEVEAFLTSIMSPEELERVGKTNFSKKYIGPKSASQMLIEDREDRI